MAPGESVRCSWYSQHWTSSDFVALRRVESHVSNWLPGADSPFLSSASGSADLTVPANTAAGTITCCYIRQTVTQTQVPWGTCTWGLCWGTGGYTTQYTYDYTGLSCSSNIALRWPYQRMTTQATSVTAGETVRCSWETNDRLAGDRAVLSVAFASPLNNTLDWAPIATDAGFVDFRVPSSALGRYQCHYTRCTGAGCGVQIQASSYSFEVVEPPYFLVWADRSEAYQGGGIGCAFRTNRRSANDFVGLYPQGALAPVATGGLLPLGQYNSSFVVMSVPADATGRYECRFVQYTGAPPYGYVPRNYSSPVTIIVPLFNTTASPSTLNSTAGALVRCNCSTRAVFYAPSDFVGLYPAGELNTSASFLTSRAVPTYGSCNLAQSYLLPVPAGFEGALECRYVRRSGSYSGGVWIPRYEMKARSDRVLVLAPRALNPPTSTANNTGSGPLVPTPTPMPADAAEPVEFNVTISPEAAAPGSAVLCSWWSSSGSGAWRNETDAIALYPVEELPFSVAFVASAEIRANSIPAAVQLRVPSEAGAGALFECRFVRFEGSDREMVSMLARSRTLRVVLPGARDELW
eukprot:tig00020685_g12936.t1